MTATRPMGPAEWLLLLTLSVLWGGSFFFNELAIEGFDPFSVTLWRVGIAGAVLWGYLWIRGIALPTAAADWRAFLVMGALNNLIPFTLIAWGQIRIDSGLAAIFNAATPLFTVLLAHVLTTDERLNGHKAFGVLIGIAGVAVLIGPGALKGLDGPMLGQLAVVAATVSYACAGIFGKRMTRHPPAASAAGMLLAAAVMSVPMAFLFGQPLDSTFSAVSVGGIIGLGTVSTALAYIIYFRLLARSGATNLLLVTLLIPASAGLLGVGVLGESLSGHAVWGMGLIALGLGAVDGRVLRCFRR
jgi:drug/metabolite transporter (DMT)-like permease